MRPYIYTTPEKESFLVANNLGSVGWVINLSDTLDWWISSTWHIEGDEELMTQRVSMS